MSLIFAYPTAVLQLGPSKPRMQTWPQDKAFDNDIGQDPACRPARYRGVPKVVASRPPMKRAAIKVTILREIEVRL